MIALSARGLRLKLEKKLSDGLDIEIAKGEIWGILGPNACGKTTLLHTLAGLLLAGSGQVYLAGQPLKNHSLKSVARHVGLLFQEMSTVFSENVWEYCLRARFPHLAYFKKETEVDKHIVLAALEKMQLAAFLKRKINHLSGGERRRLAIAALLAQTPEIYLLDEPSNHLDLQYQLQVLNEFYLLAKNENKSIVMSLHDINLAARFCDHLLLCFPAGSFLHGKKHDILTETNLSALYQCPIKAYPSEDRVFWHRV